MVRSLYRCCLPLWTGPQGMLAGRQMVIACLLVTGTALLCCDAWFDVVLGLRTGGMWLSIASAVVIELPLAFLLNAVRRVIWLSALVAVSERGGEVDLPSLWRIPLVGENAGEKAVARE